MAETIRSNERVLSAIIIAVASVLIAGIVVAMAVAGPPFWLKSVDSVLPQSISGFEQSSGGARERVYLGDAGVAVAVIRADDFADAKKDSLEEVDRHTWCGSAQGLAQACLKELNGGTLLVGIAETAEGDADIQEVTREVYQRL